MLHFPDFSDLPQVSKCNLYDPCGEQFKSVETAGQTVIQHSLGNFGNMNTKAQKHFSLEGTGP